MLFENLENRQMFSTTIGAVTPPAGPKVTSLAVPAIQVANKTAPVATPSKATALSNVPSLLAQKSKDSTGGKSSSATVDVPTISIVTPINFAPVVNPASAPSSSAKSESPAKAKSVIPGNIPSIAAEPPTIVFATPIDFAPVVNPTNVPPTRGTPTIQPSDSDAQDAPQTRNTSALPVDERLSRIRNALDVIAHGAAAGLPANDPVVGGSVEFVLDNHLTAEEVRKLLEKIVSRGVDRQFGVAEPINISDLKKLADEALRKGNRGAFFDLMQQAIDAQRNGGVNSAGFRGDIIAEIENGTRSRNESLGVVTEPPTEDPTPTETESPGRDGAGRTNRGGQGDLSLETFERLQQDEESGEAYILPGGYFDRDARHKDEEKYYDAIVDSYGLGDLAGGIDDGTGGGGGEGGGDGAGGGDGSGGGAGGGTGGGSGGGVGDGNGAGDHDVGGGGGGGNGGPSDPGSGASDDNSDVTGGGGDVSDGAPPDGGPDDGNHDVDPVGGSDGGPEDAPPDGGTDDGDNNDDSHGTGSNADNGSDPSSDGNDPAGSPENDGATEHQGGTYVTGTDHEDNGDGTHSEVTYYSDDTWTRRTYDDETGERVGDDETGGGDDSGADVDTSDPDDETTVTDEKDDSTESTGEIPREDNDGHPHPSEAQKRAALTGKAELPTAKNPNDAQPEDQSGGAAGTDSAGGSGAVVRLQDRLLGGDNSYDTMRSSGRTLSGVNGTRPGAQPEDQTGNAAGNNAMEGEQTSLAPRKPSVAS